jgi:hypothetical protein
MQHQWRTAAADLTASRFFFARAVKKDKNGFYREV